MHILAFSALGFLIANQGRLEDQSFLPHDCLLASLYDKDTSTCFSAKLVSSFPASSVGAPAIILMVLNCRWRLIYRSIKRVTATIFAIPSARVTATVIGSLAISDGFSTSLFISIFLSHRRVAQRTGGPPALPHQTVHTVFPHTAFQCSSRQGMRRVPARCRGDFIQAITPVEIDTRESAFADSSIFHFVALHQVCAHPLFRVSLDLFHDQIRISIMKVTHPAIQATVNVSHDLLQGVGGQFPSRKIG